MAVVGEGDAAERALTQVKGVDALYPLIGAVVLEPAVPLAEALAGSGGLPGAVMDRVLVDRLGLTVGDTLPPWGAGVPTGRGAAARAGFDGGGVRAGAADDRDDRGAGGVGAAGAGDAVRDGVPAGLAGGHRPRRAGDGGRGGVPRQGLRWPDRRRAAPGVERFVDRIGSFLVLVGLAGLAVGGVGVSAAVRAYLEGKVPTIATLKTLGAEGRVIFLIYLMQIGALTALGVALGLVLGAGRADAVFGRDRGAAAVPGGVRAVSGAAGRGGVLWAC